MTRVDLVRRLTQLKWDEITCITGSICQVLDCLLVGNRHVSMKFGITK